MNLKIQATLKSTALLSSLSFSFVFLGLTQANANGLADAHAHLDRYTGSYRLLQGEMVACDSGRMTFNGNRVSTPDQQTFRNINGTAIEDRPDYLPDGCYYRHETRTETSTSGASLIATISRLCNGYKIVGTHQYDFTATGLTYIFTQNSERPELAKSGTKRCTWTRATSPRVTEPPVGI